MSSVILLPLIGKFSHTRTGRLLVGFLLVAGTVACQREIQVQEVPKETPPPAAQQAALPPGHPEVPGPGGSGMPTLKWELPAGWEEVPAG